MKYKKKPIVIEAMRYICDTPTVREVMNFMGGAITHKGGDIIIHTLEGEMRARPGDWIIKGVQGEFYPCKNDIFEATYEAMQE